MHFRVRKNVIQFVRTSYDAERKKPHAQVVGRIDAGAMEIPEALASQLTADELAQARTWLEQQQRTSLLREELAARTLAETLAAANRWFVRQENLADVEWLSGSIIPEMQALRRNLKRFLD